MKTGGADKNTALRSMLSFLLVGGFATAVQYALRLLLVWLWAVPLTLASAIGFIVSAVANYLLNVRMTFRSKQSHRATAPRFISTACGGPLISVLISLGSLAMARRALSVRLFYRQRLARLGVGGHSDVFSRRRPVT